MSIELQFWSIIIPIENINKCKSLGGFEKFIESQKDRIGHDVWYDEYLYRYRVPDDDNEKIFEFWEKEGLQLRNQIVGESKEYEWKDLCLTTENGPSITCNWLEFDKDVPCVWLKGKPRGELHGSNRRKSKVISESTIGEEYHVEFFKRLYKLHQDISNIPPILLKTFNFRDGVDDFRPRTWEPPKNYLKYLIYSLVYFICPILLFVANLIVMILPKFDANKFLDIFDLIRLDKGYILDFEYCGNCPAVYTKKKHLFLNLFNSKTKDMSDVLGPFVFKDIENVSFEQSPQGFFQFAVFSRTVNQFYLYWHALENDLVFIYSKSQIEDILKSILQEEYKGLIRENDIDQDLSWNEIRKKADQELLELFKNRKPDDDISIFLGPLREDSQRDMNTGEFIPIKRHWTSKEELKALFNAPLNPQVTIIENGYGVVRILTFSKWSGFIYYRYEIKWPNSIEKVDMEWDEAVLRYNCGIEF